MKLRSQYNTIISGIVALSLFVLSSQAQSVPSFINYQGRLTDPTGAPLAGGFYTIQFRIWDSPTSTGTNDFVWEEQQSAVPVQTNGLFNVILGSGSAIPGATPLDLSLAFAHSNRYLGLTVIAGPSGGIANASEITPRQQLLSVPFVFQALQAQQAQVASALVSNLANALCPSGSVVAYMGTQAPPGWLLCDGSTVKRTDFPSLFSVVGTSSGSGDGSTTFRLPDMRGLFLRGVNGPRNDSFADPDIGSRTGIFAGGNTGNAVGSYQVDQFASHTHGYQFAPFVNGFSGEGTSAPRNGPSTYQTDAAGGTETRPKNVYVNYIIKY